MRKILRFLGASLLAVCTTVLPSCGSDGGVVDPTPTPTPTPPPVTTVVSQGSFSGLGSAVVLPVVFATSATGSLEATVDWTFATNDVDVALVAGSNPCTVAQLNAGTCPFIAVSSSTTAKPERVRATGQPAGAYTLYVANFGSRTESVSWQVTLTTGGGAAAASVSQGSPWRVRGLLDE